MQVIEPIIVRPIADVAVMVVGSAIKEFAESWVAGRKKSDLLRAQKFFELSSPEQVAGIGLLKTLLRQSRAQNCRSLFKGVLRQRRALCFSYKDMAT